MHHYLHILFSFILTSTLCDQTSTFPTPLNLFFLKSPIAPTFWIHGTHFCSYLLELCLALNTVAHAALPSHLSTLLSSFTPLAGSLLHIWLYSFLSFSRAFILWPSNTDLPQIPSNGPFFTHSEYSIRSPIFPWFQPLSKILKTHKSRFHLRTLSEPQI